jgi:hypothetical protein
MVATAARTKTLVTGGDPNAPARIPEDRFFKDQETEFLPAKDIQQIAEALIAAYPDDLGHLSSVTISYVWRQKGTKTCGKAVLGTCQRPGGLHRFHAKADFVIVIAADHCRELQMTAWQLEALVYHEMLHADWDAEADKPAVRGHDAELFADELRRYGTWRDDLIVIERAFTQVPMFG